ncbi:MliC family protein [Lacibacterium aquatile]|uniref:MliC family protein n=1 Tax=Lacibacterium aquatile TaxID=1168082 RepID=A0ABW5DPH2_9PROT
MRKVKTIDDALALERTLMRPLTSAALLATAVLTLSGCDTMKRWTNPDPSTVSETALPKKPAPVGAIYKCDNGDDLPVLFSDDRKDAMVTLNSGDAISMYNQPVASGFAYSDSKGYAIRGKGRELLWYVGNRAPVRCVLP